MRVFVWIGVICAVSLAALSLSSCSDDRKEYTASELELVGFIASHSETVRDQRARCESLVQDFEAYWQSAAGDEGALSIIGGVLTMAQLDLGAIELSWEKMPAPEADTVRELNEVFGRYLNLVADATKSLSRAFNFVPEGDFDAGVTAADAAGPTLASARDAEVRLAELIVEITGSDQE